MSIIGAQVSWMMEKQRIYGRVVSSDEYGEAMRWRDWDTCDAMLIDAIAEAKHRRLYGPLDVQQTASEA